MSAVKPIHTESDHRAALARIDDLFDSPSGSAESDELSVLATLVEAYESEHFEIEPPDPISAIKFRMDQTGLTQRDLIPYIGSRKKVSEVLSGKRDLTISMARALHQHLDIPAESLLQDPEVLYDKSPQGIPA